MWGNLWTIGDGIPLAYRYNSDWLALTVPREFSRFLKETEQSNSSIRLVVVVVSVLAKAKWETSPPASVTGEIQYTLFSFGTSRVLARKIHSDFQNRKTSDWRKSSRIIESLFIYLPLNLLATIFIVSKSRNCFETQPLLLCFSQGCYLMNSSTCPPCSLPHVFPHSSLALSVLSWEYGGNLSSTVHLPGPWT